MKSLTAFEKRATPIVRGAWVTLGIPFDNPVLGEKHEGIIDPEALILISLLLRPHDRLATDLPAWANRFSSLINHQKLKTMFKMMPPAQGEIVLKNMKQMSFLGLPKSFRQIFKLEPPSEVVMGDIQLRIQKINRIENVAQASFMIRNRLQYGTGFRADIITLSDIKGFNMRGNQIAKLLCTNDSTVSRILNDLKASKFLSRDNKKIRPTDNYPGLFISSQTLWNICELIDAFQFSREELKQAALEGLDFKHDGFGKKYIPPL